MIADIDRRTLAIASSILVITTTIGLLAIGPVGIIAGPVIDRFATPRFLASRNYKSPGAPLWSAARRRLSRRRSTRRICTVPRM